MANSENKTLSHSSDQIFEKYYSKFTDKELSDELDQINRLGNVSSSEMSVSEQVFSGAKRRFVQFQANYILAEIRRRQG